MPITHLYTLVCDDVRVENNGKLIVIGLYTPNVLVPQLPFAFSTFTFLQAFQSDRAGQFTFRAHLQHVESGQHLAQALGTISVVQPGMGVGVVRFGNIRFDRVGSYHYIFTFDGEPEPFLTSFDVVLQVMQQPG